MSVGRRQSADSDSTVTADARYGLRIGPVLTAFVFVLAAVALFSAPALADDSTPPTFGNATAVNETQFEFTIEDDEGMDESTIAASDFSLSVGSIDDVSVNESGNSSVVTVRLSSPVRENEVTVSLADGGSIADDAGNTLTDGSVTVTGMDAYDPFLQEYGVTRLSEEEIRIEFFVDEPVHNVSVVVSGAESATLGPENFTETDTPRANEWRYRANHTFEAEGEYEITLEWVRDGSGNYGLYYADRTVVYDATRPQARIAGPATTSLGQNVTFDGSGSTDEHGVVEYEWTFDGNVTGTDETFTTAFDEPGRHEVALTVADGRNNTDTAVATVEVLDVTTSRDVTIAPRNATGVDVTIGPNRTKQRVLVERSEGLGSNGSVALDSLTMTVPTNRTANLTTTALDGSPADFTVTDYVGFGAFDVAHEGARVSDVTFRFTVNRTAMENASVPPDGMALYRESGDDWTRLPALRVGGNATHLQYRATSPGLSRFVVAGTNATDADESDDDGSDDGSTDGEDDSMAGDAQDGEPSFAVVDATLLTYNVSAGSPVVARATIANDGNVTGTYVAGLSVNGSVVGTGEVTVPAGERREVTIAALVRSGGPATLNGTNLGSVAVGGGAVANDGDGGGGGLSIPNPLALWPGGLFGRITGALFWLVVTVYAILKSLAIYLGY